MEVAQEQKKIVIDPQKLKNLIKPPQKKRIFMGLLLLTVAVLSVIMIGLWKISQPGLDQIHPGLSKVCGAIVFFTAGIMILGVVNMTLAIEGLPFISALQKQMYDMIRVFFPLSVQLGKIFKISRRTLEGSFSSNIHISAKFQIPSVLSSTIILLRSRTHRYVVFGSKMVSPSTAFDIMEIGIIDAYRFNG